MKQEEIIEGNKLIAFFMNGRSGKEIGCGYDERWVFFELDGYISKNSSKGKSELFKDLHFHESWDWLMPVIEKIEKNHFVDIPTLLFGNYSCKIMKLDRKEFPKYEGWEAGDNQIYTTSTSKIEAVYKAVIEFIKHINEKK